MDALAAFLTPQRTLEIIASIVIICAMIGVLLVAQRDMGGK